MKAYLIIIIGYLMIACFILTHYFEKIENLLKENLKEMKNLQTINGTEPKE